MASMMGGDFVEAYVLKNAYKEKLRRMEAAAAAADGKKEGVVVGAGSAGEKKAAAGGGSRGGGMFGFMKKKVHPKAAPAPATETSSA
ncbi:hypothetical protein E2562_011485 [Oryza meyeriana var. granulata]|uniref:Uncharacterized protein n=1 Tax=Oryza meyeriana var. granulata TaxID=110450 RepID=A0A6G1D2D6_9ORYZ|nr:hypothetical protein E2562_011485 [Oryza meyeriana var. granulata]